MSFIQAVIRAAARKRELFVAADNLMKLLSFAAFFSRDGGSGTDGEQ